MSEQEKQENQAYSQANNEAAKDVDVTQETPVTPAPMGEWKPPDKYEVKQNSGYGMLLVIFCVVVIVVGYMVRQYSDAESRKNNPSESSGP